MSQWEEKKEWPFIGKFFKGYFGVKTMFAAEKRRKQKALKKKVSFPHSKVWWKRLAGKII